MPRLCHDHTTTTRHKSLARSTQRREQYNLPDIEGSTMMRSVASLSLAWSKRHHKKGRCGWKHFIMVRLALDHSVVRAGYIYVIVCHGYDASLIRSRYLGYLSKAKYVLHPLQTAISTSYRLNYICYSYSYRLYCYREAGGVFWVPHIENHSRIRLISRD